jgi:AcrR family transcriptional regulator
MVEVTSERAPGARRGQARGRVTREKVLKAAEALFKVEGYDGTSMNDVARRAGVGVGTLYHHFPDKHALLLSLIDVIGDRVASQRRSELDFEVFLGDDPRGAIRRWLTAAHARLRARPSMYLVMLGLAARDPEVAARYRRVEQIAISRLTDLIAFAQRRGLMRAQLDPGAAAFLIHHSIDMAAMQLFLRGSSEPDPETVLGELTDMICRYALDEDRASERVEDREEVR